MSMSILYWLQTQFLFCQLEEGNFQHRSKYGMIGAEKIQKNLQLDAQMTAYLRSVCGVPIINIKKYQARHLTQMSWWWFYLLVLFLLPINDVVNQSILRCKINPYSYSEINDFNWLSLDWFHWRHCVGKYGTFWNCQLWAWSRSQSVIV